MDELRCPECGETRPQSRYQGVLDAAGIERLGAHVNNPLPGPFLLVEHRADGSHVLSVRWPEEER